MYSFDGDYRRRPQQNFGGSSSSQSCNRDELMKKVHEERKKRADFRHKTTNAIIIQSYVRSYLVRKTCKEHQRYYFKEYFDFNGLKNSKDLEFLLKRIIFFFDNTNVMDGLKLTCICTFIMSNLKMLVTNAINDRIWMYRTKKLLYICINQMKCLKCPEALKLFQMLTSPSSSSSAAAAAMQQSMDDDDDNQSPTLTNQYLESIYVYLINKNFMKIICEICDIEYKLEKILRTEIQYNCYQMIVRTLSLLMTREWSTENKQLIFSSFINDIILNDYSLPIYEFIIPSLAKDHQFPFNYFITFLANNIICTDLNYENDYYYMRGDKWKKNIGSNNFLFYAFLKLDHLHLDKIQNSQQLKDYIKVLAILLTNSTNDIIQRATTKAVEKMMFKLNSKTSQYLTKKGITTSGSSGSGGNRGRYKTDTAHKEGDDDDDDEEDDGGGGGRASSSNVAHRTLNNNDDEISVSFENDNNNIIDSDNDENQNVLNIEEAAIDDDRDNNESDDIDNSNTENKNDQNMDIDNVIDITQNDATTDAYEHHDNSDHDGDEDDDDDDDEDDEYDDDDDENTEHDNDLDEMHVGADRRNFNNKIMTNEEKLKRKKILNGIFNMLKDSRRSKIIIKHIDNLLDSLNDSEILQSICKICHYSMLFHKKTAFVYDLLYLLALKPKFIRALWLILSDQSSQIGNFPIINLISKGVNIPKNEGDRVISMLATFCISFGHLISTLSDNEFCQEDLLPGGISKTMPFTLNELIPISMIIKNISIGLVELAFPDTRNNQHEYYLQILNEYEQQKSDNNNNNNNIIKKKMNKIMWPHILKVCVLLLRQLYTRDLRCGFCPEGHWRVQNINLSFERPSELHFQRRYLRGLIPFQPIKDFTKQDFENSGPPLSTKQIRSITILKEVPFVVSFSQRVGILQGLLQADRIRVLGEVDAFLQGPSIQINVHRSRLYDDAYLRLRNEDTDFRQRFRIQMINNTGLEEAGIDGGGIFREFLTELIRSAFDPNRGFFLITTDNKLYPNPSVSRIVKKYQSHYYFIGRVLGKALYENLLVELPLADFFLSKLSGKHSDVDVHQLASLDPILHRNLMSIKTMTNSELLKLGLDFTIAVNELGEMKMDELKCNGANIVVNASNCMEYIRLMADYKLNRQIRNQCIAFRRGLSSIINIEWLHMFSNKEFQVLISGAEVPVDIENLKMFTQYSGGYDEHHPTILIFWNIVKSFDDEERKQLLKFVTSCSRPPLLGFKDLDPAFCIQNVGDNDRLPTSSTCMNLLKLPSYKSEHILRKKLLYAIQSGSGFELS